MVDTSADFDKQFLLANKYIMEAEGGASVSNADKLKFYGLFKQATIGKCNSK